MSEEQEWEEYNKGDRVWFFSKDLVGFIPAERTVKEDSGKARSAVAFYEGPAFAVSKGGVCRIGDYKRASEIAEIIEQRIKAESKLWGQIKRKMQRKMEKDSNGNQS